LTGRMDTLLKLIVVAAILSASASVSYYYLRYLPQRDAKLDAERAEETARANARERLNQALSDADRRAAEQQQAAEKESAQLRYRTCVKSALDLYDSDWKKQCQRINAIISGYYKKCIAQGFAKDVCSSTHATVSDSSCELPHEIAVSLKSALDEARDRCLEESKAGLH